MRRYVYNKADVCSIEEVDALARLPHSLPCSASQGLNMDGLLERMWDMMALVRAYTKKARRASLRASLAVPPCAVPALHARAHLPPPPLELSSSCSPLSVQGLGRAAARPPHAPCPARVWACCKGICGESGRSQRVARMPPPLLLHEAPRMTSATLQPYSIQSRTLCGALNATY